MRALPIGLVLMLLAPPALAMHPVALDAVSLAKEGAEIVVFADVHGGMQGRDDVEERTPTDDGDDVHTYTLRWSTRYSWSATAFLVRREAPDKDGWTHEAALPVAANVTFDFDERSQSVFSQALYGGKELRTEHEKTCIAKNALQRTTAKVLGRVDATGRLVVRFQDMQAVSPDPSLFTCKEVETSRDGTRVTEGLSPSWILSGPLIDRTRSFQEASHMDLTFDLAEGGGKHTFVGSYSGGGSDQRTAARLVCGPAGPERHCDAAGSVAATLFVDPCETVLKSFQKHLADVRALQAPAKGSSESQVRAFQVDAMAKVRAMLSDARTLELMCGGAPEALSATGEAMRKVADAWFDVARTHGLSQDGVRDAAAAERAAQLAGSDGGNTLGDLEPSIARNGAPPPSGNTASVKVHSPVALHAWDEQGRHVGWNVAKGSPDLEVPNATFEGKAGDAQTLVLPEGLYRVALDELAPGTYTVNLSADATPLRSVAGGASTFVLLVDHEGAMTLAAARGPQAPGFLAPAALKSTAAPPGREGGTTGAAGSGANDVPFPAPGILLGLVAALAVALTSRRR